MASPQCRPYQRGDQVHVATHLRADDVRELRAVQGDHCDPMQALRQACAASSMLRTISAPDGEPIALFGVAPLSLMDGRGSPWLLGTDRVAQFPRFMIEEGRKVVAQMQEYFPLLENYVDVRNRISVRWLACIGFTLDEPVPYGPAGLPFHWFHRGHPG